MLISILNTELFVKNVTSIKVRILIMLNNLTQETKFDINFIHYLLNIYINVCECCFF